MKWPSLDESVSLCICLLTVACNREMQPFLLLLAIRCGGKKYFGFGSGSGSKLNCAARVGSDDLGTDRVRASILSPCRPVVTTTSAPKT